MNCGEWTVIVEGQDDKRFIESLLTHLALSNISVTQIGGGVNHLCSDEARNRINREKGDGRNIALVLDADSDVDQRRRDVNKKIQACSLPVKTEHVFLIPDNQQPGDLETLLEEITISENRSIFDCLDAYNECLLSADTNYPKLDGKARIQAYCRALRVEADGKKRDYVNGNWNLDAPQLKPLLHFLCSLSEQQSSQ